MSSPDDLYRSRFCSYFRTSAKEKLGRHGQVAAGGAELLAGVLVARRKAWPAVEKCFLKFSIIMDLSVVTLFPNLSAGGSWEEVLSFSMDFTVSQNLLELELQDANFRLKKLAFAFLPDCVYLFLTSLKSCISWGLFDASAVRHRMFLCLQILCLVVLYNNREHTGNHCDVSITVYCRLVMKKYEHICTHYSKFLWIRASDK